MSAHDTPGGPNPLVREMHIEVLSDAWYTLRRATFEIRQPNGSWVRTQREAYDRGNGVVALLHDPGRDTILLGRQYRLPAHLNSHPDGMLLELPAGLLEDGEDAEKGLRREVAEEVGHEVGPLREVFRLYMSPGSVTEYLTFFAGTYDESTRLHPGGGDTSEVEDIDVVEVTLDDARGMIDDGRICDAKTVLMIQWALLNRLQPSAGLPAETGRGDEG